MKRLARYVGCVFAVALLSVACDSKEEGGDDVKALSPAELCKKVSETEGEAPPACVEQMEIIKQAVGDDSWNTFSICAQKASSKEEAEACTTDDMKSKIEAAMKKKMEADAAERALKGIKEDLAELTKKHEAGEDISISCAGAMSPIKNDRTKGVEDPAIAELTTLCTYTAPVSKLEAAATKAEEARKANPDKAVLTECYNSDYTMALKAIDKAGKKDDEKVVAAVKRFETVCPPKK